MHMNTVSVSRAGPRLACHAFRIRRPLRRFGGFEPPSGNARIPIYFSIGPRGLWRKPWSPSLLWDGASVPALSLAIDNGFISLCFGKRLGTDAPWLVPHGYEKYIEQMAWQMSVAAAGIIAVSICVASGGEGRWGVAGFGPRRQNQFAVANTACRP